jgi:DNA processing protein
MDYSKNSLFLHLLNTFPPFGPKRITKLCNYFASPEQAFYASLSELVQCGFEQTLIEKFLAHKDKLNIEQEQTLLEQHNIGLLSPADKTYPTLLREIPDQPPILYYKGNLLPQNALILAVVGTRRITTYGKLVLPQILTPLLRAGLTIVSGMAFGVDAESHHLAIKAQKPTVAVLGSGLDDRALYPKDHQLLAHTCHRWVASISIIIYLQSFLHLRHVSNSLGIPSFYTSIVQTD